MILERLGMTTRKNPKSGDGEKPKDGDGDWDEDGDPHPRYSPNFFTSGLKVVIQIISHF